MNFTTFYCKFVDGLWITRIAELSPASAAEAFSKRFVDTRRNGVSRVEVRNGKTGRRSVFMVTTEVSFKLEVEK